MRGGRAVTGQITCLPEIVDRGIEGLNSREDPANCVLDRAGDGSQQRNDVRQPSRSGGAREQKQRE